MTPEQEHRHLSAAYFMEHLERDPWVNGFLKCYMSPHDVDSHVEADGCLPFVADSRRARTRLIYATVLRKIADDLAMIKLHPCFDESLNP